jgi:hypothetical protein
MVFRASPPSTAIVVLRHLLPPDALLAEHRPDRSITPTASWDVTAPPAKTTPAHRSETEDRLNADPNPQAGRE